MRQVILYFGSFNPVHRGHIAIAEYLIGEGRCDQLWMVVSPHNPLKQESQFVSETDRLAMAKLAVSESEFAEHIKVSDIEFSLPRPSFTIDTLEVLKAQNKETEFSLLIGSDNLVDLHKWKDCQRVIAEQKMFVYPREGYENEPLPDGAELLVGAPYFEFSSTEIRDAIKYHKLYNNMVCDSVRNYIDKNRLWR